MNSNLTEVSRPTQWKPGQSGNLNGRPIGSRQAFSAGFLKYLAEVWAEHGKETMLKTAKDQPTTFAICGTPLAISWPVPARIFGQFKYQTHGPLHRAVADLIGSPMPSTARPAISAALRAFHYRSVVEQRLAQCTKVIGGINQQRTRLARARRQMLRPVERIIRELAGRRSCCNSH